jgi:hypothetical protein
MILSMCSCDQERSLDEATNHVGERAELEVAAAEAE